MQTDSTATPAAGQLATELKSLHDRIEKMERLLRGTASIISVIGYHGMLDHLPDDEMARRDHQRGLEMLELVDDELSAWHASEAGLDFPSDDVWDLMNRAEDGRLVRYGKYQAEAVA